LKLIGAYIQITIDAQNEVIKNFKTQTNNSIATQNQLITNLQNSTISALSNMSAEIQDLTSDALLVSSSIEGMTKISRIYVNTTDRKWYY
jgi:trehalose-6-phosphate synthase